MKQNTLAQRISDGALFLPSFPADSSDNIILLEMLSERSQYYFRRVIQIERAWWQLRERYMRTGEIWMPLRSSEFNVITKPTFLVVKFQPKQPTHELR